VRSALYRAGDRAGRGLLAREAACQRDGQVYIRGAVVAPQAGLGRPVALRLAGDTVTRTTRAKTTPFDGAVWQASGGDQPAWESPWDPAAQAGMPSARP